jgi:hypothetical protein
MIYFERGSVLLFEPECLMFASAAKLNMLSRTGFLEEWSMIERSELP